jgi:hypothetical protein
MTACLPELAFWQIGTSDASGAAVAVVAAPRSILDEPARNADTCGRRRRWCSA